MVSTRYDPTSKAFRLANSPFYLMAHADYRYHEDMEKVMAKRGLNKTIYRILTVLRETGAASVTTLSEVALTKRTTVSRIVERMNQMGLVTSAPQESDNRVTEVRMTPNGQEMLDALTPMIKRQFARATEGVSAADLDHLAATLKVISANLAKLAIE